MPKRQDRTRAIDHERRQLEKLKILEPVATDPSAKPLSDALVDIAIAALDEVYMLENGEEASSVRLQLIYSMVQEVPALLPDKESE